VVNPYWSYNGQIREIETHHLGGVVHLREYGINIVFNVNPLDDEKKFWSTDKIDLEERIRSSFTKFPKLIEFF
jgi:hypothetical protein